MHFSLCEDDDFDPLPPIGSCAESADGEDCEGSDQLYTGTTESRFPVYPPGVLLETINKSYSGNFLLLGRVLSLGGYAPG